MTVIAGLLDIGITSAGVRGLHCSGLVSIPLGLILGIRVAADAASMRRSARLLPRRGRRMRRLIPARVASRPKRGGTGTGS